MFIRSGTEAAILDEPMAEAFVLAAMVPAEIANRGGNPPFGCMLVEPDNKTPGVWTANNEVVDTQDDTAHAEMRAMLAARAALGRDLGHLALVTNVEPCPGCFTFALKSGIRQFYFGARSRSIAQPYIGVEVLADSMREPITIWMSDTPEYFTV